MTEICRTITGTDLDIRKTPGVNLRNTSTGEIIYTPPEGQDRLKSLLANWERFIHEPTDIDPLIIMAVQHCQFEAIHPFPDGNGRTGRVANVLFLTEKKLLNAPILYLSQQFLMRRDVYYKSLELVTNTGNWEQWVIYVLSCVAVAAAHAHHRVHSIMAAQLVVGEHCLKTLRGVHSKELMDVLFQQPYCRINNLVDAGIAKRQTASVYLRALSAAGVLKEIKAGKEKIFLNTRFLQSLTRDPPDFELFDPSPADPSRLGLFSEFNAGPPTARSV